MCRPSLLYGQLVKPISHRHREFAMALLEKRPVEVGHVHAQRPSKTGARLAANASNAAAKSAVPMHNACACASISSACSTETLHSCCSIVLVIACANDGPLASSPARRTASLASSPRATTAL